MGLRFPYTSGSQPGVRVPLGVSEKLTGVHQILKTSQNKYIWVELLVWGVRKGDTTLIWGYVSTKRLRTPALYDSPNLSFER